MLGPFWKKHFSLRQFYPIHDDPGIFVACQDDSRVVRCVLALRRGKNFESCLPVVIFSQMDQMEDNIYQMIAKSTCNSVFIEECCTNCQYKSVSAVLLARKWQRDKTRPNLKYLTYRIIITLTFFVTWVLSMVKEKGDGKWPIFLTNWGYTLCTAQALLAVLILASCVMAEKYPKFPNLRKGALKFYSVYWILNTMATSTAFGITFIYWIVIYDAKVMKFDAMNYFVHGNNSILMMLDLWMVAHPVRILHFLYTGLFAISYSMFSIIYFAAGGTSRDGSRCIYKIVDWDNPVPTTFTCLGVMVFLIVLHMMAVAISVARRRLNEKCLKTRSSMTETKGQAAYVNEGMSSDIV